jgi:hypothetical protein
MLSRKLVNYPQAIMKLCMELFQYMTYFVPLADKKIIYVASAEGLPIAHNFILRNPSIPIEKIVYRKPGSNECLSVLFCNI